MSRLIEQPGLNLIRASSLVIYNVLLSLLKQKRYLCVFYRLFEQFKRSGLIVRDLGPSDTLCPGTTRERVCGPGCSEPSFAKTYSDFSEQQPEDLRHRAALSHRVSFLGQL